MEKNKRGKLKNKYVVSNKDKTGIYNANYWPAHSVIVEISVSVTKNCKCSLFLSTLQNSLAFVVKIIIQW
jgi:hypothetical protein